MVAGVKALCAGECSAHLQAVQNKPAFAGIKVLYELSLEPPEPGDRRPKLTPTGWSVALPAFE